MSQTLALTNPTRQARCSAWLVANGVSKIQLATILGVHPSYVGKIITGERRPKDHIAKLISLGIPADLLPEPCDGTPGPKPKSDESVLGQAA